jgi:hypothetical protein
VTAVQSLEAGVGAVIFVNETTFCRTTHIFAGVGVNVAAGIRDNVGGGLVVIINTATARSCETTVLLRV